ncbi:bacillithiol biosynthesis cysteine-adding enzyme BshC, partial [Bacteroidia bacterium]|nr:bacillithiol biosynthesis cysteine-adding enzyme BshC [Bacteroidia bacterium]
MEIRQVDRSETFFHSPFIADYYSDKFDDLRTYKPQLSELGKAIEGKATFSTEKREILVNDFYRQYAESGINTESSEVGTNIELLQRSDAFTITTGQQIHIGLGPLYVLYKIFDVLAICNEARELYPDKYFIPVFWMASEDHDLEEIQDVPLFGKNYHWETSQKGPVGRMNPKGVSKIFNEIEEDFNLDNDQIEFVNICREAYSTSDNLSQSFRKILHHYFAHEGLIIMDADSVILKNSCQTVLTDELQSKNFASLQNSTERFESKGYKRQLIIRECNLFDLSSGDRLKVKSKQDKTASAVEGNESFYNLSPNAALRPFYQEWILPNLVYVGGGSEVKYWMQLKGLFDNYSVPMPIIHLRTSCMSFSRKSLGILDVQKIP